MTWYEHLYGIAAMIVCFVGYPCAIMAYCCYVVGGRSDVIHTKEATCLTHLKQH